MPDNPIGEAASAVVDGLAKTGQTNAIIEFGVLWSGLAAFLTTSLGTPPFTYALEAVGAILVASGGVALTFRVVSNIGR